MKKPSAMFIMLAITMVVLTLAFYNVASAKASSSYGIESVNHTVQVLYNGYVLMNDTIAISGHTDSFMLGFPHVFGSNVVDAFAYSTNDTSNVFPLALNVPMQDNAGLYRAGFYGARVDFSKGTPQVFSVVFVLSNLLLQDSANVSVFALSFPAFPSLTETASFCNCSVVVPGAQYLNGTVSDFTYNATDLSAFTYNASQVAFFLPNNNIQIFEIQQLTREVDVNAFGQISVSDSYRITNNSTTHILYAVDVDVPFHASNVSAHDSLGALTEELVSADTGLNRYRVNFSLIADPEWTVMFTVTYSLPDDVYVSRQGNNFAVNMMFFEDANSYIDQTSVRFVLPEGARLSSFSTTAADNSFGVNRDVFQETMTVNKKNVISLGSFGVSLSYGYNPLWLALGPTMWIWVLSIVGSVIVVAWKTPRALGEVVAPPTGLRLRPEDVRSFVDSYDEKMKIESEIDVLEDRVQKGRIPRRRYKVQKKTFEIRLNTLDKSLGEIGGKMHSASGNYSDMMRRLEVAETEIDEVETNIKSIEARHGRGEISLETHHKLLADYERRKDRAKTTINGILLRLREEIH